MLRLRVLGLLVLVVLCVPSVASARSVIYVSPAGDNSKAGTTPEEAVRGIWKGLELVDAGGEVRVAGGEYRGQMNTGAWTIDKHLTLTGGFSPDFSSRDPLGEHQTKLIGARPAQTALTIDQSRGGDVVVDGLSISGEHFNDFSGGQLSMRQVRGPLINVKALGATPRDEVVIRGCLLVNAGNSAIALGGSGKVTIEGNVFLGCYSEGVKVGTNHRGPVVIKGNSMGLVWGDSSRGYAVRVETGAPTVLVEGNTFGLLSLAAIGNTSNRKVSLFDNVLIDGAHAGLYKTRVGGRAVTPSLSELGDVDLFEVEGNRTAEVATASVQSVLDKAGRLDRVLLTERDVRRLVEFFKAQ